MDYLFALGYNGSNLNAKDSKKVLDAFVNEDPKKQLKIITDKDSQEAIFNAVKKANEKLPNFKHIKSFKIMDEDFERTTTNKVKRFGKNVEDEDKEEK